MASTSYKGIAGKMSTFQEKSQQTVEPQMAKRKFDKQTKEPDKPKEVKAEEQQAAQQPDSKTEFEDVERVWDGTCYRQKLGKHDENYGKPRPGTKTEVRGKRAGNLVTTEVATLCQVLHDLGHRKEDGTFIISFGFLFEVYTKISNKLVGMLLRARRQGLVKFEGEMLYQGRDENVIITLLKIPKMLEKYVLESDGSIPDHMKMDF